MKDDKWVEEVSFFDVKVWGKRAEACAEHLGQGSHVLISGKLKQERWKNDEDQTRSRIVVNADKVQFLGKPKNGGNNNEAEDDVPF